MSRRRSTRKALERINAASLTRFNVLGARAVRGPGELTLSVPRRRGSGRRTNGYQWAILVNAAINETLFDDYLLARLWDPATDTYADEPIVIAKPYHLMRSTLDGQTVNYLDGEPDRSYTYDDNEGGQVRQVDDGVDQWEERVDPAWYEGELIRIAPVPAIAIEPEAEFSGTATFGGASPQRIIRSSGSWVDDGFIVGATITVAGTANNDGTYTLATVGATLMTVDGPGFVTELDVACTITQGIVAHWQDVNREARKFRRVEAEVCLGSCLEFDGSGCIAFDTDVNSTVQATVVTGGSLSIVAGTPNKLRLTLTRSIVTFSRNACGVLVAVSAAGTTSVTSDLNLDECS